MITVSKYIIEVLKRQKCLNDICGLFQVQEDLTEEKKRELEHNAEETYGENDENV